MHKDDTVPDLYKQAGTSLNSNKTGFLPASIDYILSQLFEE